MSVLPGILNNGLVKGLTGGTLEAYGALTGNKQATTFGHAITDPAVTVLGGVNPGYNASSPGVQSIYPGIQQNSQGLYGYNLNSQPKAQSNPGGTTPTGTQSASGTFSGGAAPAVNPNQFQIDQVNNSLGRLPTQLQIAQGNIQGQYGTNLNELNSGETAAKGQYQQGSNQNTQNYVANKNTISGNASSGLHSLLRLLGLHGAGGSSDYSQAAPQAIATQAAQQRSGAGQTFGQNQQGLDTNWNNYESGVGQSKQKLNDWLSTQLNSAQSQSDTARSGLLQSLAGLQSSQSLAQPYIDQSNGLLNDVDQLAKLNPTYDGKAPTYTAPNVASYQVNPLAPIQQNGGAGSALDSVTSPFWSLLQDKTKNPNQLSALA